ncbi:MAG: efflux RND transporter periplasmic adaptor subunit [Bacteroidetes bacterium]|jgi:HlyD family secretion protein|nr:efflux RND transporter periplasmic adaptor subunit [Bacteroidota bacterium]
MAVIFLIGLVYTLRYLYAKDQAPEVVFETKTGQMSDIVKKTVATGSIVPRQEVDLKPRVSGIVSKLYVAAGQMVRKGDKIALIKIIPNVVQLNQAENRVKTARLNLDNARMTLERNQLLLEKKALSPADFERIELTYKLAQEELQAAAANLELIQEGSLKGGSTGNNTVVSTVEGMVLDVPVKEGASVIESNNFNDGTTIVTVANMDDMIFEGTVDESEVGKLREGMVINLIVGAIDGESFTGTLEYISPKGQDENGTIQFEIRASVAVGQGSFLRAGYSANAEIVLEQRSNVLAIEESLLLFEMDKRYVEVEVAPQQFEKREVVLGLSDGLLVEVLEGITLTDRIKIQEAYGKTFK